MKIIDCFMLGFDFELDLLEYRLEYLNNIVDYFVIVEANFDFQQGNFKDYIFEKNKDRFLIYQNKIQYVKVEKPSLNEGRECYQRNCIKNGLDALDLVGDDIVILSDIDEFPSAEGIVYYIINRMSDPSCFTQDMYYYYMNTIASYKWSGPQIARYKTYLSGKTPQDIRDLRCTNPKLPVHGGWHFSYMGGSVAVQKKIEALSDGREYEKFKDNLTIEEHIQRGVLHLESKAFLNLVDIKSVTYPENLRKRYRELLGKGLLKPPQKMDHYYKSLQGWFTFPGFYSEMVKRFDSGLFVELGSFAGMSSSFLGVEIINSNKNIKLICVDTFEGSSDSKDLDIVKNRQVFETFLRNILPVRSIVGFIKGYTYNVVNQFDYESVDMIFIDADHSYESVRNDIHMWYPKVKKGGIIAGHDYGWPPVNKAVKEYFGNKVNLEFKEELVWYVEKR